MAIRIRTAAVAAAVVLWSCKHKAVTEPTPPPPPPPPAAPVATITLSEGPFMLAVGNTRQLTVTAKDAAGNALLGRVTTWGSTNETAVTVNGSGLVTAVAPGSSQVSALSEGKSAAVAVTVPLPAVASVTVSAPGTTVPLGSTLQASALLKDAQGNVLLGRTIAWSVLPSVAASISSTGLLTPNGAGPATIRATSETIFGDLAITISNTGLLFKQIKSSNRHGCGVTTNGNGYCWGNNSLSGALGDGSMIDHFAPALVVGGHLWQMIIPGADDDPTYTCGLDTAGASWCWGHNSEGSYGNGDLSGTDFPVPTPTAGGHFFLSLVAGDDPTCALSTAHEAWCWGGGDNGTMGDGAFEDRYLPVKVIGGHLFSKIAMGGQVHACGLTTTGGELWCWGEGALGGLGNGSEDEAPTPVRVSGPQVWTDIGTGDYFSCGLAAGEAWCWGRNVEGEVGDGTLTDRLLPVKVSGAHVFTQISVGRFHACGLTALGEAWCWGENFFGQLGNGNTNPTQVPVQVNTAIRFATLSVGGASTCGITAASEAYCWGGNGGTLGDGTTTMRLQPVLIGAP